MIASISPLVARTITMGVTTATRAEAAMKRVNGGHGATKVRYEKTASAHAPRRVSVHVFIFQPDSAGFGDGRNPNCSR